MSSVLIQNDSILKDCLTYPGQKTYDDIIVRLLCVYRHTLIMATGVGAERGLRSDLNCNFNFQEDGVSSSLLILVLDFPRERCEEEEEITSFQPHQAD